MRPLLTLGEVFSGASVRNRRVDVAEEAGGMDVERYSGAVQSPYRASMPVRVTPA
jgi:hypothetical protein